MMYIRSPRRLPRLVPDIKGIRIVHGAIEVVAWIQHLELVFVAARNDRAASALIVIAYDF